MDCKLTCGAQICHIRKKAAHIFVKLYPYLSAASADGRRDMWQTMVSPLFNSAYVLLQFEPSEASRATLERVQKMTFKKFLMVSKRTNSILVNDMMRKDLRKLAYATVTTCNLQWEQRKAFQSITAKLPCLARKNGLRGVPNNWCELVNTMVKPCPSCNRVGVVTSGWHLLAKHRIKLVHINYIWKKEILPITAGEYEDENEGDLETTLKALSRNRLEIRGMVKPIIQRYIRAYYEAWAQLLVQSETAEFSGLYN